MSKKVNIIFVGGTRRAVSLLRSLCDRDDVAIVYAVFMEGYEDERVFCDELIDIARVHDVEFKVSDVITEDIVRIAKSVSPDVILGGGIWRSMVPEEFYKTARLGFIGLHGSGLPEYRGWAGLNWYIINGESEYKMRMLRLDADIDSGPLVADKNGRLFECSISLNNDKHVGEILAKMYEHHVRIYNDLLDHLLQDDISFVRQDNELATYTCHRGEDDSEINWGKSTKDVFNLIRAVASPYPGAYTFFNGRKVVIWKARRRGDMSKYIGRIPGKVVERNKVADSAVILTVDGGVEILEAEDVVTGEKSPCRIFNSVRRRCTSEIESIVMKYKISV